MASLQEFRGSLENPATPLAYPAEWLLDLWNGGRTDSGIRVSEITALNADTVLSCVNVVTRAIASLPLHIYNVDWVAGHRYKFLAQDHDLYQMLHRFPNPEMTSHTLRACVMLHMLLWGNGYIEIQRNKAGDVLALWPRNPGKTRPVRTLTEREVQGETIPPFTLCFETSDTYGDIADEVEDPTEGESHYRHVLAKNMLFLPGLSLDGRIGQSLVQLCRQTIGLALASEKYAAKFFGNGAVPIGLFEVPEALEPKATEELRRQWQEAYGGENSNRTAVLDSGAKYTKIAIDPDKGQLNELRTHQVSEIAAIFGVPQHMIPNGNKGNPSGSVSNIESQGVEFLNYCLSPWIDTWQQEIDRKLLYRERGRNYESIFETRSLTYTTAAARQALYSSGLQFGYFTVNDVRAMDGLNPINEEWADKLYITTQLRPRTNGPLTPPPTAPTNTEPEPQRSAYRHVFQDALVRATTRHKPSLEVYTRIFEPILESMLLMKGKEVRDLSTNPQVQSVVAGIFQRWGQYKGSITDADAINEANRAGSAL